MFAALATMIWSGNFLIARGLNDKIPPVSLAFWRWAVATVVLVPFIIQSMYAQRDLLFKHIGYLVVTSLLGVSVFNTLIYLAGKTTSALNSDVKVRLLRAIDCSSRLRLMILDFFICPSSGVHYSWQDL